MMSDRVWFLLADWLTPAVDNSRRWGWKNWILRRTGMRIGEQTAISRGFSCYNPAQTHIGRYVALGENVHLFNFATMSVGDFTTMAQDISIVNGWHQTDNLEPASGPLVIGRGTWVGLGVRIVGSITLGDFCIVGAGSLVIEDVPARAIVVGVPAKVVGYRELAEYQWHFRQVYFHTRTFQLGER